MSLALNDRQIDSVLLEIVTARADGNGITLPKFLSLGELETSTVSISRYRPAVYSRSMSAWPPPINGCCRRASSLLRSGNPAASLRSRRLAAPACPAERRVAQMGRRTHVTLAIVFTDIVDSTALNIESGDAAMRKIHRDHFAQSANFLGQHDGFEVKTIGDGILSVFRSVNDALAYALALHSDPGSSELQVRAGIHIGPVEVTEHDIEGAEVAIASRVVGAIAGAEIWMSSRAKEDIDRLGSYRNQGWHWQPHDVSLKGVGATRLWSLAEKSPNGGEADNNRPRKPKTSARSPPGDTLHRNSRASFDSKFTFWRRAVPILSWPRSVSPRPEIAGRRLDQHNHSFIRRRQSLRTYPLTTRPC